MKISPCNNIYTKSFKGNSFENNVFLRRVGGKTYLFLGDDARALINRDETRKNNLDSWDYIATTTKNHAYNNELRLFKSAIVEKARKSNSVIIFG